MSRKQNHRFAMREVRLHPSQRDLVRKVWAAQTVEGLIHALDGADAPRIVEKAAALLLVVHGAAQMQGLSEELPEIRVTRGTVNTVVDCTGCASISAMQRQGLVAGLQAVQRLVTMIDEENLFIAAQRAQRLLGMRSVTLTDFEFGKGRAR